MALTNEQIIEQIEDVLEQLMPYFLMHGGNITLDRFEDGKSIRQIIRCMWRLPIIKSYTQALVEAELKKEIPQVDEVIQADS